MPETSKNNHRDYSKFDNMSTEMLEDILRADSLLPNDENSDTDAILYIMEVIAKREIDHPSGKFTDVNDAWASFSKDYLPYTDDDKSLYDLTDSEETGIKQTHSLHPSRPLKPRLLRVASIAAILTVFLLATTITASAFGFDLWGAVAKWTKDTFGFSSTVSKTATSPQITGVEDDNSLQGTIKKYGIEADIVPTWFPEGYVLENINPNETPAQTIIFAQYTGKNGNILLKIIILKKSSTGTYEKDDENVTIYSKNKIEHYIMSNLDQTKIIWQVANCECSISGMFTINEAKKMIDSIYERN